MCFHLDCGIDSAIITLKSIWALSVPLTIMETMACQSQVQSIWWIWKAR